MEETGVDLSDVLLYRVRTFGRHVEILFTARTDGKPEVLSREIIRLDWFDTSDLPEEMNRAQKALIREVLSPDV
jgi:hypothetical protein